MSASSPIAVQIDGIAATGVDALDRGMHYGDGLFETIACRAGLARFLDLHLQRLTEGCARLGIRLPALPVLAGQLRALAATQSDSLIKLILTRGNATARGYGAQGDETPRTVVLLYRWPAEDPKLWEQGVAVRVAPLVDAVMVTLSQGSFSPQYLSLRASTTRSPGVKDTKR